MRTHRVHPSGGRFAGRALAPGSEGEWSENWDVHRVDASEEPSQELTDRLAADEFFKGVYRKSEAAHGTDVRSDMPDGRGCGSRDGLRPGGSICSGSPRFLVVWVGVMCDGRGVGSSFLGLLVVGLW